MLVGRAGPLQVPARSDREDRDGRDQSDSEDRCRVDEGRGGENRGHCRDEQLRKPGPDRLREVVDVRRGPGEQVAGAGAFDQAEREGEDALDQPLAAIVASMRSPRTAPRPRVAPVSKVWTTSAATKSSAAMSIVEVPRCGPTLSMISSSSCGPISPAALATTCSPMTMKEERLFLTEQLDHPAPRDPRRRHREDVAFRRDLDDRHAAPLVTTIL